MPGFNIAGQGTRGPNSLAEVRRTHRWVFKSMGPEGVLKDNVLLVLKTASRPSLTFEEPAMHHNQEQVYFAGKHTWEPLSLSWYDVEQDPNVSEVMFNWIEKCLILHDADAADVYAPGPDGDGAGYKASIAHLEMINGRGVATEDWEIYNGWPQAVNWNALDYSSSDLQLIEVKFRFDRAKRLQPQ